MKKEKVKKVILDFEKGDISAESTVQKIYDITLMKIDALRLKNYWRSESMEAFIDSITYEVYKEWKEIDDVIALKLLNEIKDNIGDDAILARNSEALERRFKKPTGIIVDLLFQNDFKNEEILRQLKIDTVTLL